VVRSERIARLLIKRWPILVLLLAVVVVGAGSRLSRLEFDFAFRHFFLGTAEDWLAGDLSRRFGDDAGSYLVAVLECDDILRADVLAAVVEMSDAVASLEHVRRVFGLATVPFIRGQGSTLSFAPVTVLAQDGVDLSLIRAELQASPLYSRRLLSTDGKTTALLALLDDDHRSIADRAPTIGRFREAIESRLPAGTSVRFTGYPITEAEYARTVLVGFATAQAVGIGLIGVVLYLVFRSAPGVVLPLLSVGIATLLVLGLMQLTGQRLTFTNASVPLMMLVIGVAEVSFLVARFYEEAAIGWDDDTSMRAFASALWPGFIAACTTSAGFFALGAGHIGLTRDFGFNMGVAGLVTYAVAAILIPGALTRWGRPASRALRARAGGVVMRWLERAIDAVLARPWTVLAASIAIVVFGVFGAARITLNQYATRELGSHHPILRAQEVVDTQLAGSFQTNVAIVAPDGGSLARPDRLRAIEALQGFLAGQEGVVKAWSVVDYLKELHLAVHGGGTRSLPPSADLVEQYLFLLSSGGAASDLPTVIDEKARHASIVLGTTDIGTDRLRALHHAAADFVRDQLGGVLSMRFVGDYWEIARGNEMLAWDQAMSTMGAFLLLLPFVGLLLQSWRLVTLCVPPNVVPLLASIGLMGLAGFDLRTGTSIILPVTLGVAIDNTTHLVARAREEWLRDGRYDAAVRRAVLGTGWAMTSSTIALLVGFLAYQVPPFRTFSDVGLLASWTMVVALAANLFLTPMLIVQFRPFGPSPVVETGVEDRPRDVARSR
jgi:uncharacterized protein